VDGAVAAHEINNPLAGFRTLRAFDLAESARKTNLANLD
jgi:hypothetical protein